VVNVYLAKTMSPIPYVRGQVMVLAILIAGAGLFDAATFASSCGILALAWLLLMRGKYRKDLRINEASVPSHRASLDRAVAGDALAALLPTTILAVLFLTAVVHPLTGYDAVRAVAVALAVVAAAIWASSLVDWYVILPRISGQLGARPCRAAVEEPSFPFPNTWKEVTRWWYIHRAAAAFVFRAGLSAALAAVIGELSGLSTEAQWLAAAVMLIVFNFYNLAAVGRGVSQAGHAKAILGETVRVERRAGHRSPWFPLRKLPPIQLDSHYYVYDVSIEQVQVADIEPKEQPDLPVPVQYEKDPDSIYLTDIDAVRKATTKFRGCENRCSGISWYCIENPRCFEVK
jgi:hypothetical protein